MSLKKTVEFVKKHKNFLITSHRNPEGDAIGSQLAFFILLEKMGKRAVILNEDEVPYECRFLPQKEKIKRLDRNAKRLNFDCMVFLDCSDLRRPGDIHKLNIKSRPVLNIDHHMSNERFGQVNWVESGASSCAEMVYKLYKKLGVSINKEAALCLYTGIITDTGSFRYSNTGSFTHKAAAELLEYGINPSEIYRVLNESVPFDDAMLLAGILPALKRGAGGKIIWCQIKHQMLEGRKLRFDLTDQILSFARSIEGVEVCVLFKENLGVEDEIRVNFRSQGKVDVHKIALFFGGGGHRTASAATIRGKIDDIVDKVLKKIEEEAALNQAGAGE